MLIFKNLYASWLVALLASAGSLYFSHVMDLPPCSLCWWQRIFMFPLPIVLGVAFVRREVQGAIYALALALIGQGISIYHNLLYYGAIPKPIVPCSGGISCTEKQIQWAGFISIPLLSLITFTAIVILLIGHLSIQRKKND